jgi:serine/threonine-protein kinase RsbW
LSAPQEPSAAPGAQRYRLRGQLSALAGLANWCAALARRERLDAATAQALDLCLSELVSNVIEHGGAVPVVVEAVRESDSLMVTVWDAGRPFDPLQHAAPPLDADLDRVRIGGLGLTLVRRFARELRYAREGDWNRLSFVPQG